MLDSFFAAGLCLLRKREVGRGGGEGGGGGGGEEGLLSLWVRKENRVDFLKWL